MKHELSEQVTATTGPKEDRNRRAAPTERVCALRIHRPNHAPFVLPLDGARSTLLIGRGEQADVRLLGDDRISRIHGMLRKDDDEWFFVDLGSANGTFAGTKADAVDAALTSAVQLQRGQSTPLSALEAILFSKNGTWLEPLTSLPESTVNRSTRSPAGRRFEEALNAAAPSSLTLFLLGPSGVGKTWAARVLHDRSGRKGPFVALNCARLPADTTQLASELLGHVKGAFTDARTDRVGRFFEADGGTLFLDEVESLSPVGQGFLLDLLEPSGQLIPLGAVGRQAPKRPLVRIVSASKATLHKSSLRADLAFRLASEEHIAVPRLADRREDIPGLVLFFLSTLNPVPVVTEDAMKALTRARWDGEVRELEGTVRVLAERARRRGVIDVDDVLERLESLRNVHGVEASEGGGETAFEDEDTTVHRRPTLVDQRPVHPQHLTKEDIVRTLASTNGNIEQATRLLGVARNTLTSKMDRFGIPRPQRGR